MEKKQENRWWYLKTDRRSLGWTALRILCYIGLMVFFFTHQELYTKVTKTGIHFARKRILLLLISGAVCSVLPLLGTGRTIPGWVRGLLTAAEIPVFLVITLYVCERIHDVNYFQMRSMPIRYNFWLAFAIFVFFFAITARCKCSLVLTYLIVVGFSALNYCIYQFRGDPMTPADLYVAGTALSVAADYSIPVTWPLFEAVYVLLSMICLLAGLPGEIRWKGRRRAAISVVSLVFVCWTFYLFSMTTFVEHKGVTFMWFNTMKRYRTAGELLFFVHGFYSLQIDEPEDYSAKELKRWAEEGGYVSDSCSDAEDAVKPNLIFIMNESLADLTTYEAVKPSEDPFPFIHGLRGTENAILGNLHVDVFGGQTANTEYQVLTGASMAYLPPAATAYVLFVRSPQPSLTWNLRDLGYQGNIAFHPHDRNNYNRPRAYEMLGFESFVAVDNLVNELTDGDYLRNRVSDAYDFRKIIQLYESTRAEQDGPFYLYNVTMQNHGPFNEDFDNFQQSISLVGELEHDDEATRYINLTRYTDEAFRTLTEYFSQVDEPTILVMYGDHQPKVHNQTYKTLYGKSVSDLEGKEVFQRYVTPLVIWANYPINEGGAGDGIFENISVNYLGAALTDLLKLPETGFQKYLLDLREKVPVFTLHGYLDQDGNYYETEDENSPWYDWVHQYHKMQYNYQFDRGNRNEEFFRLRDGSKE